jgi:hypothetical protein
MMYVVRSGFELEMSKVLLHPLIGAVPSND